MAFGEEVPSGVSPTTVRLIDSLLSGARDRRAKPAEKADGKPGVYFADPNSTRKKRGPEERDLTKSLLATLNGPSGSVERLAFEVDPTQAHAYASLYRTKARLLPDSVLKRIAIQDDLVAAIVNTRSAQLQSFGRPQPDRFSTGFKIIPDPSVMDKLSPEQKDFVEKRVDRAEKLLVTCGRTEGWKDKERLTLSQWLGMSARNAIVVGRIATERIYTTDANGDPEFHSFRPLDAGTVYRAYPQRTAAEAVRRDALNLLAQLKNKRELNVNEEQFQNDEYSYVQVLEGTPRQVFHDRECVVRNFYQVDDVEMAGYPVTPLDTAIAAVTMHINITTHNRLYFQNGRASRGILVVRSDDVSQEMIKGMRHQFQASINSANNSWRLPVFGVGKEDEVEWQQIDVSARDMEFQYLSDMNARVIMSAFQISPEELPGYQHLCLSPDSQIWTEEGATTIGTLLGDEQEVGGFKVWTGTAWSPARAFWTGQRRVRRTMTGNGVTLTTSPEHLFRVVEDGDGGLGWKRQDQLRIGDVVLVNRNPVPGSEANVPSYRGRRLTPEMAEVLGWLTGDGTITVRKKGKVYHSKELEFYYHHDKEVEIRERHLASLTAFGLDPKVVDRQISEAAAERQKRVCGFKSVASVKRMLKLYDTDFVAWLLGLGFKPASEGKAIPDFIHGLPVNYRGAFLRGFFSADGSKDKLDTPSITIAAEETREQTKKLLLNMGIRTRACEGTRKTSFFKKPGSDEFGRTWPSGPSKLIVKDKREFYEKVGFLQAHKQPDLKALAVSDCRWDKVSRSVAVALADRILATLPEGAGRRDSVRHALKDPPYPFQARLKVQEMADRYGVELPSWTREFYQEPVIGLEVVDEMADMVDVEVFNDAHAFVADGVVVHNSRGTNSQALSESNSEYKLEASRDVGIRPLIGQFEDFVNGEIFPCIDPTLAKFCVVQFLGLDADTPEKELTSLQEAMGVHLTYDDVLEKVEKEPVGAAFGGQMPLNPMFLQILDRYLTVGQVLKKFFGVKDADKDPKLAYMRDPFFFQWVQLQQAQAQAQAQQQAQPPPGGGGGGQPPQEGQGPSPGQDQQAQQPDLTNGIDQVIGIMSKAERDLPPGRQRLLALHRKTVAEATEAMRRDLASLDDDIVEVAERHAPRKR